MTQPDLDLLAILAAVSRDGTCANAWPIARAVSEKGAGRRVSVNSLVDSLHRLCDEGLLNIHRAAAHTEADENVTVDRRTTFEVTEAGHAVLTPRNPL